MLNIDDSNALFDRMMNPPDKDTWKRFCSKIQVSSYSGCWEWRGTKQHGYGRFHYRGSQVAAHTAIVKWLNNCIPAGFVVDHFKCDNRCCVNPDHLKVVSKRDNVLRSNSVTGLQSRQQSCKKGHPLSGDNIYMDGHSRRCRICKREYNAIYGKKRPRKLGQRKPVQLSETIRTLLRDPSFVAVRQVMINPPDEKTWARFISLIVPDALTGCWVFQSSLIDGYGQFSLHGKTWKPHRLIRTWIDGGIPKKHDVHHICYCRACVNPDHLEYLKPAENILDSENSLAGRNARKTHCKKGHPFAGANLMRSGGKRMCRTCHNAKSRNRPAEEKRTAALKSYYKKMADPKYREAKRIKAAEYRKNNPDRIMLTEARRR